MSRSDHNDQHNHSHQQCGCSQTAPKAVVQTLDEMEFERGIWTAGGNCAIGNGSHKSIDVRCCYSFCAISSVQRHRSTGRTDRPRRHKSVRQLRLQCAALCRPQWTCGRVRAAAACRRPRRCPNACRRPDGAASSRLDG